MEQNIIEHKHAMASWITIRVARNGEIKTRLVIETDLTLNAESPNYQKDAVNDLAAIAVAYVRDHAHIDEIEIEPI